MSNRDARHLLERIEGWQHKLRPYVGVMNPPEAVTAAISKFHLALDVLDRWVPDQGTIVELEGGVSRHINNSLKGAAEDVLDRIFDGVKNRFLR